MSERPATVLIGAGRMGLAMAKGWLNAKDPPSLTLIDPHPSDAAKALAQHDNCTLNPPLSDDALGIADRLVLAVKPQVFDAAAPDAKRLLGQGGVVISVMAGIPLARLQSSLGAERVVRTMPTTPGAVGKGVTLFCLSDASRQAGDDALAEALLSPLGVVEGPIPERLIDAATTISGCGPAYVFLLTEAMTAAGVKLGLPQAMSARLARETVIGSGALMAGDPSSAEDLRKAVTSPGGVTQAALEVLMKDGGVPTLMAEAVEAALERARALS